MRPPDGDTAPVWRDTWVPVSRDTESVTWAERLEARVRALEAALERLMLQDAP